MNLVDLAFNTAPGVWCGQRAEGTWTMHVRDHGMDYGASRCGASASGVDSDSLLGSQMRGRRGHDLNIVYCPSCAPDGFTTIHIFGDQVTR